VLYASLSPSAASQIGCNDDTNNCGTGDGSPNAYRHGSKLTLNVAAGTTYYFFVDGYSGSTGGSQGNFVLTIFPPP
jgi:hypothetical protein